MGGIVSDLLEETRHLDGDAAAANGNTATTTPGSTHPVPAAAEPPHEEDYDDTGEEALAEDATQPPQHDLSARARERRLFRGKRRRPLAQQPAAACGRGQHRMCRRPIDQRQGLRAWPKLCPLNSAYRRTRPLTFGERLERLYQLEDPTMVERSSTPTMVCGDAESAYCDLAPVEEEYCAWTSYLQTPGTFHGQLKPNLPGAFSGMCFPQSDPRWIVCCQHPNVPSAVKSIIN